MQMFLVGFFIISLCELFTIGGFPLKGDVRIVSALLFEALSCDCSQMSRDRKHIFHQVQ